MVTRAASSSNAEKEGNRGNERLSTMHKDAIVMATAMANAPAQDQARSPPNVASVQNHQRDTPVEEEQSNLPPSPMVTPPIRSYNAKKQLPKGSHPAGVPHVYHDYSQVPDVMGYVRKKTGGVTNPFPEKLHEMLHAVSNDSLANQIVSWCPHGRAFIVRRPKDFTEEIMPKYFKQTKLTSFQRQLNLYGFRRITQGTDAGAYYHELFLRGRPGLCQRMVRQKVKGTGHKQPADAKTEPNFYAMPSLEPADAPAPTHHFVAERGYLQQQQQQQQSSPMMAPTFSGTNAEQQRQQGSPVMATVPTYSSRNTEQEQQHESSSMTSSTMYSDRNVANAPSYPQYSPRPRYLQLPPGTVLDSPASPGLHGAAHLLQGIASGFAPNLRIPEATSLGPSAAANDDQGKEDDTSSSSQQQQHQGTPVSFLQPRLSPASSYKQREYRLDKH